VKQSHSEFIEIHGLRIHVRRWRNPGSPRIFMLHGWMDCSAPFQFLVDEMVGEWDIIAPDWRGFGLSGWKNASYWFPEYCLELNALLDHYSADRPANIVAHSMGANITSMFAGMHPSRVAKFVNLDSYGTTLLHPVRDYPEQLRRWMALAAAGPRALRGYASVDAFSERLMQENPRLTRERANFVATHFTRHDKEGRLVVAADPWHRIISPVLQQGPDASFWQQITARALWVRGEQSHLLKLFEMAAPAERESFADFRQVRQVMIPGAGHNVHHDQPELLARIVEAFLEES
jgi:pimeloyl-ACP methyl ester carboxylesterase